jgi:hypothetical protein
MQALVFLPGLPMKFYFSGAGMQNPLKFIFLSDEFSFVDQI